MFSNTLRSAFIGLPVASASILSLPSSSPVRQVLFPVPALLAARAILRPPREDAQVEETYLYGLFSASLGFRILDYLYLHGYDTPRHFYRVDRVGNQGAERQAYPDSIWDRVKWGLSLLVSQRGIGWNTEVPLPETKYSATRREFIRQSSMALLGIYLGLYLVGMLCERMVQVLREELPLTPQHHHATALYYYLFRQEAFQMLVSLAGWVMSIISHVSLLYNLAGVICVAFGIGGRWKLIRSWPKTFGSFRDAWSIRSVWGKAWHQTLRRSLSAPGERAAELVLGESSKLSYPMRLVRRYFLLFSAFAVSGILHALGVYFVAVTEPMPHPDSTPLSTRPPWYTSGYFFSAQALAIMVEDFLCWIGGVSVDSKEVGANPAALRWIGGAAYTLAWFVWSTTVLWIHPQLAAFGYQRTQDEGKGYVHVLEATARACSMMPLNPWPLFVDGTLAVLRDIW
ncbi:hypothetical protein TWF696_002950 [Orbilia brochopaga]|uniref:Wax synthase domain-containing protein n=1 Tax=Orbilia brochopaga TaxID=3140254 RepID=A0AAV9TZK8_9PEZI